VEPWHDHIGLTSTDVVPAFTGYKQQLVETFGLAVFVLAQVVLLWAMHVNRFFSSVVRIQTERGHHVITTGPYRWVRHPGYAAAPLMILASGLGLGSWLATLIALAGVPLLMVRTRNEEAVLQRDLPGYADYAQQVRFRLVPLIW
jgi:protein-S-isoprenylcysteine O-methyltransferase Ste14